jgi:hypothetical protein
VCLGTQTPQPGPQNRLFVVVRLVEWHRGYVGGAGHLAEGCARSGLTAIGEPCGAVMPRASKRGAGPRPRAAARSTGLRNRLVTEPHLPKSLRTHDPSGEGHDSRDLGPDRTNAVDESVFFRQRSQAPVQLNHARRQSIAQRWVGNDLQAEPIVSIAIDDGWCCLFACGSQVPSIRFRVLRRFASPTRHH